MPVVCPSVRRFQISKYFSHRSQSVEERHPLGEVRIKMDPHIHFEFCLAAFIVASKKPHFMSVRNTPPQIDK